MCICREESDMEQGEERITEAPGCREKNRGVWTGLESHCGHFAVWPEEVTWSFGSSVSSSTE